MPASLLPPWPCELAAVHKAHALLRFFLTEVVLSMLLTTSLSLSGYAPLLLLSLSTVLLLHPRGSSVARSVPALFRGEPSWLLRCTALDLSECCRASPPSSSATCPARRPPLSPSQQRATWPCSTFPPTRPPPPSGEREREKGRRKRKEQKMRRCGPPVDSITSSATAHCVRSCVCVCVHVCACVCTCVFVCISWAYTRLFPRLFSCFRSVCPTLLLLPFLYRFNITSPRAPSATVALFYTYKASQQRDTERERERKDEI